MLRQEDSHRGDARTFLSLYGVAAIAVLLLALPTPVYWDTWGYVRQAIAGDVGGLGLGRPVFVLLSQAIAHVWLAAGGSVWHAEPVLRVVWAAISCTAAPLTWQLALLCGLSPRAAVLAGLAVACSPAMAHVSGTLLTDAPAAALLLLSFVLAARAIVASHQSAARCRAIGAAAAAGAVLGLAIGVREQSALAAATLALMAWAAPSQGRARLAFAMALSCVLAIAVPIAFVAITEPGYADTIRGWLAGMAHDRALEILGWTDALLVLSWLFSLGPFVVIGAAVGLTRQSSVWRARTILFAVVLPSLVQLAAACGFLGIAYSPRFLVAGFAGAIAIPGASLMDRWAGRSRLRQSLVVAAIAAPVIVAAPIVRVRAEPMVATLRALPTMLSAVPANAAIVTGYPCPALSLIREQISRDRGRSAAPDWQPVCPGWAWPRDLRGHLDAAARAGRPVVIDLRPTSWIGAEQRAALQEAATYARERVAIVWQ